MNQLLIDRSIINQTSNCGELMTMAERELTAFVTAVTKLFGSEQAKLSAEEWLRELAAINDLPSSTEKWRRLTVDVSARLAKRLGSIVS
jgi:hypothetical protein